MNKFEHVRKGGGMVGPCTSRSHIRGEGAGRGSLYGEVQCIIGNGYMGFPYLPPRISTPSPDMRPGIPPPPNRTWDLGYPPSSSRHGTWDTHPPTDIWRSLLDTRLNLFTGIPPPREQTLACENITFPQLLLRVVKTDSSIQKNVHA